MVTAAAWRLLLLGAGLLGAATTLAATGCSSKQASSGDLPYHSYLTEVSREDSATAAAATSTPSSSPTGGTLAALPDWLPKTLQLGVANDVSAAKSRAVAPFTYRYQYLAGGVNTGGGWATWNPNGSFVDGFISDSAAAGMTPVFTYYQLRQSQPGAGGSDSDAIQKNVSTASTMNAYFADLKLFFQRAAAQPNVPVILHVEPDLWGFLEQQSKNNDASQYKMLVAGSGSPDASGFPDSLAGFAQAIVAMRNHYAPNVRLGYHLSIWGSGDDIVYSNPNDGKVDSLSSKSAAFYGSLHANFDIAFAEFSDRDAGFKQVIYGDGGAAWWDAGDFQRNVRYLARFSRESGLRLMLWQIPLGNTKMRALNNTWDHFQDNKVEWLLGDASGAHLRDYMEAGVVAFLFGRGADGATCACDASKDGVTNPAPIGGNTRDSLNADDDGGYFAEQASGYYQRGPLALP